MIKVSVIIPVYNRSDIIETCIDSIINQSYENIEIICIDDGSTDDTFNRLKLISLKDKRIKVYHQSNKGVSGARNEGLKHATGDAIMFVDSDDTIARDYITSMVDVYKKNSVVKSSLLVNGKNIDLSKSGKVDFEYVLKNVVRGNNFNQVYTNLIDKKIIDDNKIRFNEDLFYGEDLLFILECYHNSDSIILLNDTGYNYNTESNNSITRLSSFANITNKIDNAIVVYSKLADYGVDNNNIMNVLLKKVDLNLRNYIISSNSSYDEFLKIINYLNDLEVWDNIVKDHLDFDILDKRKKLLYKFLLKSHNKLYYYLYKLIFLIRR